MTKTCTVYVDGVFDLFHEGHINLLRVASSYGKLIVGVHSDTYTAGYKRIPIIPERTRYEVVRACRYVDEIIEGVELLSEEMIDMFRIDLVLHGNDFSYDEAERHYRAAINRGIFKFVNYTPEISSSKLIHTIENRFSVNGQF